MKEFHISQFHRKFGPHENLIFWISMIKESFKVVSPKKDKIILDFGCGDGKFLHLYEIMDSFKEGYGIEINEDLINKARELEKDNIYYLKYSRDFFYNKRNYFDVVYSQEVLYTIKDLKNHAYEIFNVLKPGGYYFATMGNHIQNPLWSLRRKVIKKDYKNGKIHYFPYDYSLDDVAESFYTVGFEVGLKRLPLEYFMIYDPVITREFSNSVYDLVKSSEEEKMLFLFWKPYN